MTISYIGIGASAGAVNASVSPTLPPSPVVGDLMVIVASIRNSGAGSPDQPAGWATMLDMGNVKVFGQYFDVTTVAPTITFTGGVALADTQAAIVGFRGVAPNQLTDMTTSQLTNGSAQNIAYPALDIPGPGYAVMLVAWKQDDATSIPMPAGFTGSINNFVTAGDDATLRMGYSIQTTEADIGSGSLVVTGGAAAISKAAVIALMPAVTFSVTTQELVYPPRTLLSVSGLLGEEFINLYRVISGQRTLIRGGEIVNDDATAEVVIDAELPFGVPVSYVAVVNGAEYTAGPFTLDLPGGKVVFSDAVTGLAAEAVITSWPEKTYERRTSVYRLANGKTKVVVGPVAQFAARVEVFTLEDIGRTNLQDLLESATSGVLQVRQPGGYHDVDCYVCVLDYGVRRYSQDGTDDRRIFALNLVGVDAWGEVFEAAGYTYADLDAVYTGLTYADLDADFATYLALATAELEH